MKVTLPGCSRDPNKGVTVTTGLFAARYPDPNGKAIPFFPWPLGCGTDLNNHINESSGFNAR